MTWLSRMRMCRSIGLLTVGLAVATSGYGQQADSAPVSFEVASIKRSDPDNSQVRVSVSAGRFTASNATVKMLLRQAFEVRDNQISGGPAWFDSETYDIVAKIGDDVAVPSGASGGAMLRTMLRSLLVERFGLTFHREMKSEQVYQLVVAKGSSKLKEAEAKEGAARGLRLGKDRLTGMAASTPALASNLSQQLGRPVIDKTELHGVYDFVLEYAQNSNTSTPATEGASVPESSLPSIFTALQESLGLKLESTTAPVEILVVDHAERPSGD
jgi:uncharacterized protein (TIGR03435 family)